MDARFCRMSLLPLIIFYRSSAFISTLRFNSTKGLTWHFPFRGWPHSQSAVNCFSICRHVQISIHQTGILFVPEGNSIFIPVRYPVFPISENPISKLKNYLNKQNNAVTLMLHCGCWVLTLDIPPPPPLMMLGFGFHYSDEEYWKG